MHTYIYLYNNFNKVTLIYILNHLQVILYPHQFMILKTSARLVHFCKTSRLIQFKIHFLKLILFKYYMYKGYSKSNVTQNCTDIFWHIYNIENDRFYELFITVRHFIRQSKNLSEEYNSRTCKKKVQPGIHVLMFNNCNFSAL